MFKKNDFGNLNTPYERLVEKRELDKLHKKMKLISKEVTSQRPQRQNSGGGRGFNEPPPRGRQQFGNNTGGNRGLNRGGRDAYVSPFQAPPSLMHDPFGRNDITGRGYSSGNAYNLAARSNSGAGGGYNAPFGRTNSHDPAIERLEMLEREIASLRQMQASSGAVGLGIGAGTGGGFNNQGYGSTRATLEDARGLFNDLRYDRPAAIGSGSSSGGGRGGYLNDDLAPPPLKRLCPEYGRGTSEQSFNDRYGKGGGGGNNSGYGGRKFY